MESVQATDVRTIAFAIRSSCQPRGPVGRFFVALANGISFIVEESPLTEHTCVYLVKTKKSRLRLEALSDLHTSIYRAACGWARQINIELALSKLQSWRDPSNIAHYCSLYTIYG